MVSELAPKALHRGWRKTGDEIILVPNSKPLGCAWRILESAARRREARWVGLSLAGWLALLEGKDTALSATGECSLGDATAGRREVRVGTVVCRREGHIDVARVEAPQEGRH